MPLPEPETLQPAWGHHLKSLHAVCSSSSRGGVQVSADLRSAFLMSSCRSSVSTPRPKPPPPARRRGDDITSVTFLQINWSEHEERRDTELNVRHTSGPHEQLYVMDEMFVMSSST
ncbi:hypothetical protein EYF80_065204 [Liparis tanakae]|uniref:Uncharacterized protein n=1 Tax=Liparis tanakae TaxID=230148 RepID=A0A4Z2E7X3_9TELE|nr:hypothetical protein EYF80_065204 [Liparis tanakae]